MACWSRTRALPCVACSLSTRRASCQYDVVHNLNIGRSVDETLRVLEALQTGGLCAADWQPGQANLRQEPKPCRHAYA